MSVVYAFYSVTISVQISCSKRTNVLQRQYTETILVFDIGILYIYHLIAFVKNITLVG